MSVKKYAGFFGLILSGIVLGYSLAYILTTQPILAPANHHAAAEAVTVKDVTTGETLTLKYMGGVFSLSFPSLSQFPPGHNYAFSRWELDSSIGAGEVEAFMVVAGPGIDGKTYGVEISRKCWDELSITVGSTRTFTFPQVLSADKPSLGYISFEFIP